MLTGTWLGRLLACAGWFSVLRAVGGERSRGVVAARPPALPPGARGIMREFRGIAPWLNPALLSETGPCGPAGCTHNPLSTSMLLIHFLAGIHGSGCQL